MNKYNSNNHTGVGCIGIYIHIGNNFSKVELVDIITLLYLKQTKGVSVTVKQLGTEEINGLFFKDTMQLDNCLKFDKMAFMVDLRIDVRSKEMLNKTPRQKSCDI